MGKRGKPPRPARLRLLDGAQASKVNLNEPIPRSGKIDCPEHVSDSVRVIFDRVVADLEAMHIASPTDVDSIVAYCEAVEKHREASVLLAKSSMLIRGMHGNLVKNPALQVQRDSAQLVRQFAQEFGLTPSARARIDSERGRSSDDFENPFASTSG